MFNQNSQDIIKSEEIENIIKNVKNEKMNKEDSTEIKELLEKITQEIENKIKINQEQKDLILIIMKIEKVLTNQ